MGNTLFTVNLKIASSSKEGRQKFLDALLKNCKLMLKGNAYTVDKIIKLFTGKSPLKVLDMKGPKFEEVPKFKEGY